MTGNVAKPRSLSRSQRLVMLVLLTVIGTAVGVVLARVLDAHWLIVSATIGVICGLGQLPASKLIRRLSPPQRRVRDNG